MLSREYMVMKLLQWNPHWRSDTVERWHYRQLHAIYSKERARVMQGLNKPAVNRQLAFKF